MYLLYSAAFFFALWLAAPYFLYQALAHKKYLGSLAARLGFEPISFGAGQRRLLIHCVSVGEFLAAEPLIERLHAALPELRLVISTTTAAGQQLARERAGKFADICYFPLDFGFAVRRLLVQADPVAIVVLETELWPNFLHQAARRQIPVLIANGRISDRSFRNYKLVRMLLRPILKNVAAFLMQSEQDAARIRALGARDDRVSVCGNIKYDLGTTGQTARFDELADRLSRLLTLARPAPLLVAGSTTPGEEELLVAAYRQLISEPELAETRLLIAPRRPERFDEVARLLAHEGFPPRRRSLLASDNANGNPGEKSSGSGKAGSVEAKAGSGEVILLDSIGELAAIYRFADLVFVGGSLVPRGGHNILEPALYGRAIVTGPYMNNFQKIIDDFKAAQAVVQLAAPVNGELPAELSRELIRLMKDRGVRDELGARARAVLAANRGALDRHCKIITETVHRRLERAQ